jgi:hypothetical protein
MTAAIISVGASVLLATRFKGRDIAPGRTTRDVEPTAVESRQNELASRVLPSAIPPRLPAAPIDARTEGVNESAERTRQLVKILSEVNTQPGELTPEKADQWKQHLEQVIEQGRSAVPALEQYFDSNANVQFDTGESGDLLGEPTLRIALLKILFDIPTPENVQLQEKVLQSTTDPAEITLLARQLEAQEPGEHYRSIIQAARRALQDSNKGLADRDRGSLLAILDGYGIPAK